MFSLSKTAINWARWDLLRHLTTKNHGAECMQSKVVSYAASGMDIDYGLLGAQPEGGCDPLAEGHESPAGLRKVPAASTGGISYRAWKILKMMIPKLSQKKSVPPFLFANLALILARCWSPPFRWLTSAIGHAAFYQQKAGVLLIQQVNSLRYASLVFPQVSNDFQCVLFPTGMIYYHRNHIKYVFWLHQKCYSPNRFFLNA